MKGCRCKSRYCFRRGLCAHAYNYTIYLV